VIYFLRWLFAQRARLTGYTSVAVRCEGCGRKYYYRLERTVRGEADTDDQARRMARRNLKAALGRDIDPVPCPDCGRFRRTWCRCCARPACADCCGLRSWPPQPAAAAD
jgi:hypothetical protein